MTYQKLLDKDGNPILAEDGKFIWVFGDAEQKVDSLWRTTITLYNKKIDFEENKVKWYCHVIHNCFWGAKVDASKRGGGFQAYSAEDRSEHEVPSVVVRIPFQRKYQTPIEWDRYPNGFTVKPGDLIFKGVIMETFSDESGGRVNDVLEKYGHNAITVKKVSDNLSDRDFVKHIHAEGY